MATIDLSTPTKNPTPPGQAAVLSGKAAIIQLPTGTKNEWKLTVELSVGGTVSFDDGISEDDSSFSNGGFTLTADVPWVAELRIPKESLSRATQAAVLPGGDGTLTAMLEVI
jgi:hypothetical protein